VSPSEAVAHAERPILEACGVSRRFGGVRANEGVSIALARGEIRGLIGPNGAGKTTLVNVLTGIYPPDAGTVHLDGEDITGLSATRISRRGMLRTFQTAKLFGSMTVVENLMVPTVARRGLFARGRAQRDAARANHLLALTQLEKHRDLKAQALSGGEQALLQTAVGLMVDDIKCYVMDEPFAGINPVLKERIVDLIRYENRERGTTFLIISHEMATLRLLCERVTVLAEGSVLFEGTMDEVTAHPQVIAAYLGRQPQ
jgi:branched-chain amino acid transport system ATP-binding protein